MAPFVRLSLLGQLTLWYVWNNGVSHSTTELPQWLCIMLWNSRTLWTRFSEKKSYHKNWRYHTYILAEKPSLARWDSNFDDLITLKTVFGAIMLLDETETHLCKSSYQHCVCDVHAEYTVVGHTLKKHQLLVTKEISPWPWHSQYSVLVYGLFTAAHPLTTVSNISFSY